MTSFGYNILGFGSGETPLFADFLIVAGGGSGSGVNNRSCGGGGAGGFREFTNQELVRGTAYTVTVGAGGAAVAADTG
jgi:hypothetical protein